MPREPRGEAGPQDIEVAGGGRARRGHRHDPLLCAEGADRWGRRAKGRPRVSAAMIAHRTLRQDVNRDYTHQQATSLRRPQAVLVSPAGVAALLLKFLILPPGGFGLSQLGPATPAIVLRGLMVLLTPCIDYVSMSRGWRAEATEAVGGRAIADARSAQASAFAIACKERPRLARRWWRRIG